MSKVSVHIVTWNSLAYLENALASLDEQTFRDYSILIVDNGSKDGTKKWLQEFYPHVKIVKNRRNIGFAKAHNQALQFTSSEYVLVMNHDVVLTETFLENLVNFIDAHPAAGAVTGKVYKLTGNPARLKEDSFTKIIDSVGLKALKNRRIVDLGEGEVDMGQFSQPLEVFGVSGCLPLYRREALESIAIPTLPRGGVSASELKRGGDSESDSLKTQDEFVSEQDPSSNPPLSKGRRREYFDEDFVSYKEDADLAWRLRLNGWQAWLVPSATAYHFRGASGKEAQSNMSTALNRRQKPQYANQLSYWNHLLTLVKNEQNFWRHVFYILWYELKKLGYILLFEQKTLKGIRQFFKLLSKMRQKRKIIQEQIKVNKKEMRKWFE